MQALATPGVGGSAECNQAVRAAFVTLEHHFDSNRPGLKAMFNTCGTITTDGDCYLLHDFISDDFMGLVQYNNQMGAVNIESRCAEMLNTSLGATPFERLVHITNSRSSPKSCVYDPDPSGVTSSILWSEHLAGYANATNPGRSFPYQMCIDGVGT